VKDSLLQFLACIKFQFNIQNMDAAAMTHTVTTNSELSTLLFECKSKADKMYEKASFLNSCLANFKASQHYSDKLPHLKNKYGSDASSLSPLSELDDDEEVARKLFERLIAADRIQGEVDNCPDSGNFSFSLSELHRASQKCLANEGERTILDAIENALKDGTAIENYATALIWGADVRVNFEAFFAAFQAAPRVRGERVRWAGSLGLAGVLARLLPHGDAADGLRGLRELSLDDETTLARKAAAAVSAALPQLLRDSLARLRVTAEALAQHEMSENCKFLDDGPALAQFATLGDFYRGPEAILGAPNPRVYEGIEHEHCKRSNANHLFLSPNYNVHTTPKLEWEFVVNPKDGIEYPHTPQDRRLWKGSCNWKGDRGRDVVPIKKLLERPAVAVQVTRAGLLEEEAVCLRLYTGPMFVLYNAALRGLPDRDVEYLEGNMYETTVFVIASGVTKLAKVASIPTGRLLYRGIRGDLVLPDQFWRSSGSRHRRVDLIVRTGSTETARLVSEALTRNVQAMSAAEAREILVLPSAPSQVEGHPAAIHGATEIRVVVVSTPRTFGKDVRLAVRLPRQANQDAEAVAEICKRLEDAVLACCASNLQAGCNYGSFCSSVTLEVILEESPGDFRGGVEFGLLSLTASRTTAMDYGSADKGRRGTLFEVQV
jgi:hypothetical protein